MTTTTLFTFNGKFDDLEQVAEFLPEFLKVYEEVRRGEIAYNSDFIDRIPGIANKAERGPNVGTHEEAAIYLLQGLKRQREQDAKVKALLAEGFEWLDDLRTTTKFRRVVLVPQSRMGGSWAEYADARLVSDARDTPAPPLYVLPKGRRTNGYLVGGRRVLVMRANCRFRAVVASPGDDFQPDDLTDGKAGWIVTTDDESRMVHFGDGYMDEHVAIRRAEALNAGRSGATVPNTSSVAA